MPNYPNIFTSQSKEFSQDAFIDWLLRCADPANTDSSTRVAGRAFVRYLIRKHNTFVASLGAAVPSEPKLTQVDPDMPINEVLSQRQYKRIDVMGRINGGGGLYIIFENKLGTGIHDNQLTTYRVKLQEEIKKKYPGSPVQIMGVYYKVFEESDYDEVRRKYHYCTLSRQEMRDFLSDHILSNPIIQMYHAYLDELDGRIHQWKRMTIAEMCEKKHVRWTFWSGWLSELCRELKLLPEDKPVMVGWGWVNNIGGGFHAMWMGDWVDKQNLPTVYLQCNESELTVRMSGDRTGVELQKVIDTIRDTFATTDGFILCSHMKPNASSFEIAKLGKYIQPVEDNRPDEGDPSVKKTAAHLLRMFDMLQASTVVARSSSVNLPKHENEQA